jgi:hypothetical protein
MYLEILLKWSQKLKDGGITILINSREFAVAMRRTFICFKSVKFVHIHWPCFLRNRREGNRFTSWNSKQNVNRLNSSYYGNNGPISSTLKTCFIHLSVTCITAINLSAFLF